MLNGRLNYTKAETIDPGTSGIYLVRLTGDL